MTNLASFEDSTKLKSELLEGEIIEWKGRPEPFRLMNEKNKGSLVLRWVICAAAAVILSVAYAMILSRSHADFSFVAELVIILIFGYAAIIPIMDRTKIIKKCKYYVTNMRVIVAVGDKDVFAISRKGIKAVFVPAGDGCVNLLFGSYAGIPEKKYIISALVPGKDEKGEELTGIEFFNIKDDKQLRAFFN